MSGFVRHSTAGFRTRWARAHPVRGPTTPHKQGADGGPWGPRHTGRKDSPLVHEPGRRGTRARRPCRGGRCRPTRPRGDVHPSLGGDLRLNHFQSCAYGTSTEAWFRDGCHVFHKDRQSIFDRVARMKQHDHVLLGSSFGAVAAAYAEHRPAYAEAAVRWACEPAPGPRVLDLGAGTGKLSATLLNLGAEVIAVEPDPAMLNELRHALPGLCALLGRAEALPLPDGCVDAVLAGNRHALVRHGHCWARDRQGPGPWWRPGRSLELAGRPGRLGCRACPGQRERGRRPAGHTRQLAP